MTRDGYHLLLEYESDLRVAFVEVFDMRVGKRIRRWHFSFPPSAPASIVVNSIQAFSFRPFPCILIRTSDESIREVTSETVLGQFFVCRPTMDKRKIDASISKYEITTKPEETDRGSCFHT